MEVEQLELLKRVATRMGGRELGRATLLVLVAAAAACAPTPPSATAPAGPTPSSRPSPGVARTVAFTVIVPHGWSDMTANSQIVSAVKPDGDLLLLLEGPPPTPVVRGANDVTGVIAVTEPRSPIASSDIAEYLRSVTSHGATGVTDPAPAPVGPTSGTAVTYQTTYNGTPIQIKDVLVGHGGAMYEIELITSLVAFSSEEVVFDKALSSGWTWVSGD